MWNRAHLETVNYYSFSALFELLPMEPGEKKTLLDTVNASFYAVMEASNFLVKRPINEFMRASCLTV